MPICTRCQSLGRPSDKTDEEFPSNGDGKGGRRKQCKECMREINKQWRATHKAEVAAYNKKREK